MENISLLQPDNFDILMRLQGWSTGDFTYESVEANSKVIRQIWVADSPPFKARTDPDSFFFHFGDTTFRKLLRHIYYRRKCSTDDLKKICSNEEVLEQHLSYMTEKKIIARANTVLYVNPLYEHITDIGKTLEWYIAEWFQIELGIPARYGVHIRGLATGGDLDVVAFIAEKPIMVECKISNPENIEDEKLHLFLQRVAYFKPTKALLLVDTNNKLDSLYERIRKVYVKSELIGPFNSNGVTVDKGCIYVTNTCKGIHKSLSKALGISNNDCYQPLAAISSLDIHRIKQTLPSLTKTDSLVMKLICDKTFEANNTWVRVKDIYEKASSYGISREDFLEAIDVLNKRKYISAKTTIANTIEIVKTTVDGFQEYAKVYLVDYMPTMQSLASLIVTHEPLIVKNHPTLNSKLLSSSLEKPQRIVDHMLDFLEHKGFVRLVKYHGGTIAIIHVSPELKRILRNGIEL